MSKFNWIEYTKRKVTIRAIRYEASNAMNQFIVAQSADSKTPARIQDMGHLYTPKLYIRTLEGEMEVREGDYVVIGTNGEFYPCKPDAFEQVHKLNDRVEWLQLKQSSLVGVHDWVHGVDSSTIYGAVIDFIEKEFERYSGLAIPGTSVTGEYIPVLHVARIDDIIIKAEDGSFYCMAPKEFQRVFDIDPSSRI